MHKGENYYDKFIDISHLIQKEFARNIAKYGDKIKCKKGCYQCCHQIFRVTMADSYIIKKFLNTQSPQFKSSLKERASEYIENNSSKEIAKADYYISPKFPCPALNEDGACMIYEARPVICRRFGPPVYDYKNPGKLFACELNFAEGEEIIDNELIPNQTRLGKEWDKLKTDFNTEFGLIENASTTIAEAILNS